MWEMEKESIKHDYPRSNSTIRDPVKLTMLYRFDCLYCNSPQGELKNFCVCPIFFVGYYSCSKPDCFHKMTTEYNRWLAEKAYGDVKYLKDKDICVKRSNGEIESGWNIISPVESLHLDMENAIIYCRKKDADIARWCKTSVLKEINPPI